MRKFDVNFRELGPDGKRVPPPAAVAGLVCSKCGCADWHTLSTRRRPGGFIIRRRACRHCGHRVTTRETTIRDGK